MWRIPVYGILNFRHLFLLFLFTVFIGCVVFFRHRMEHQLLATSQDGKDNAVMFSSGDGSEHSLIFFINIITFLLLYHYLQTCWPELLMGVVISFGEDNGHYLSCL